MDLPVQIYYDGSIMMEVTGICTLCTTIPKSCSTNQSLCFYCKKFLAYEAETYMKLKLHHSTNYIIITLCIFFENPLLLQSWVFHGDGFLYLQPHLESCYLQHNF